LTDEQRLQIGAAIHRRLWRRTRAEFARAVEAKFADDDLSALWTALNKIPTADRATSISTTPALQTLKWKSRKAVCRAGAISVALVG
jgi:hypothetical protein